MPARSIHDLPTPSLLLDVDALDRNVGKMAERLPGSRLRPHVKAHKSTAVARRQSEAGHTGFCCATIREMEGLAEQGLGQDLLLANEVLDARRLGVLDARVTVAVDSFPAGEFGYIQGTLTSLGSDALPPDNTNRTSRFPATVRLEQQSVEAGNRQLNLQSGVLTSQLVRHGLCLGEGTLQVLLLQLRS